MLGYNTTSVYYTNILYYEFYEMNVYNFLE